MRQMQQNAIPHDFDATITLNDHYLAPALAANRIVVRLRRYRVRAGLTLTWSSLQPQWLGGSVCRHRVKF